MGTVQRSVAGGLLAFATLAPNAVAAAAPEAVGWWQRALTEPPPATDLSLPIPDGARPTAVEVPEGGLYVANDASGPRAVSALRFPTTPGDRAVIVLDVAGEPIMPLGARLLACPTAATWEPVANGSWADRPDADCEAAVPGVFGDDRTSVTFDLDDIEPYDTGRGIDMVITPAGDEVVSFAIAFEAPQQGAFEVPHDDGAGGGQPAPPSTPPTEASPVPPRTPPPVTLPRPAAQVDLGIASPPVPEQAAPTAAPVPRRGAGAVRIGTDGTERAVATAVIALGAAAVWLASGGMPTAARRRLVSQEATP